MAIRVAEYLGIRTDTEIEIIPQHVSKEISGAKPVLPCPFKNSHCEKARRGDKPVCSVRDVETGKLWIVCPSRLCATVKGPEKSPIPLNEHQKSVLHDVAQNIFDENIARRDVLVDREVAVPIGATTYSADYVMWRKDPRVQSPVTQDRPVVLEMQGGGETTATGSLTRHITAWEKGKGSLIDVVRKSAPLVTNAWRRQQEQFLVKGNTAMLTGGRIVFCIGPMLYDYLMPRLTESTYFPSLRNANWTLALLVFRETDALNAPPRPDCAPHSIPLSIDSKMSLFTNYGFFVQAITNQGTASPSLFNRKYTNLD